MWGKLGVAVLMVGAVLGAGLTLLGTSSGNGGSAVVLMGVSGAREKAQADQSMV